MKRTAHRRSRIYHLIVLTVLLGVASPAGASPISIGITGTVRLVDDRDNILAGAVNPGDLITGFYTYDSDTPDSNPFPTVGDYRHTPAPFGISLNVNGLTFSTDSSNVNFLVEIVNDHGIPLRDNYLLRSFNNVFSASVPGAEFEEPDNHISWQLDDPTAAALSSTALPTVPPVLADWESIFGLDISSIGMLPAPSMFLIRSDVTSAVLVEGPVQIEPSTWGRVKAERR